MERMKVESKSLSFSSAHHAIVTLCLSVRLSVCLSVCLSVSHPLSLTSISLSLSVSLPSLFVSVPLYERMAKKRRRLQTQACGQRYIRADPNGLWQPLFKLLQSCEH